MALKTIGRGTEVVSGDLNDNFEYLDGRITDVGSSVTTVQSNLASVSANLSNTISGNYSTLNAAMTSGFASVNSTLSSHTSNKSNPHVVTKAQIGLGNCDNTSDLNKPISTATQTALTNLGSSISAAKTEVSNTITSLAADMTSAIEAIDMPTIEYY